MGCVYLKKLVCQFCSSWLDHRGDGWKKCRLCGYTCRPGAENMISMIELLCGNKLEDQLPEVQTNLNKLLVVLNKVRTLYGLPMFVTSALRSLDHHIEIYKLKGITDTSKIPMGSKHLRGLACDFKDTDGKLAIWCLAHEKELLALGIFLEKLDKTVGWVHMQIVPYGSYVLGKSIQFEP